MSTKWEAAWAKVRDEGQCRSCGSTESLDPAHVVPRARVTSGGMDPRNIVPLCRSCHTAFDDGAGLDLLPVLSLAEQSFIAGLVGIAEAFRRATGVREVAA